MATRAEEERRRRGSSAPLALETVHHDRLHQQVVRQVQKLIASGKLKPGDKLPPDRELARLVRVSRASVQQAVRELQLMGLVTSRQGSGTRISNVPAESIAALLPGPGVAKGESVAELLEVRKMLEPPVAASAATRATPEQIARLEELLRRQEEKTRRGEPAIEEDSDFHYTIAMATRNTVVRKIVDLLMDQLREERARGLLTPGRARRSLDGHQRILAAIRKKDPLAAQRAMLRHIREIEDVIINAQQSPPSSGR